MRIWGIGDRRVTPGDVLIGMGVLAIAGALFLPVIRARSFRAELGRTIDAVEDVRQAALSHMSRQGSWPEPAEPGEVPDELTGLSDAGLRFANGGHPLQWQRWSVVDSVEAPLPAVEFAPGDAPPAEALVETVPLVHTIGAVSVRSANADLLGELLAHFGPEVSFVRDTTWTLILPQRGRR